MQSDWLLVLESSMELVSFEHLRDGKLLREADHAFKSQRAEPLRVKSHLCLVAVEDPEDLIGVGLSVLVDFFGREHLAGGRATARIPDERSEIADEKNHLVAKVLEVLQLTHEHGMAQVQIGCGRIEAGLHPQWYATLS